MTSYISIESSWQTENDLAKQDDDMQKEVYVLIFMWYINHNSHKLLYTCKNAEIKQSELYTAIFSNLKQTKVWYRNIRPMFYNWL